LGAGTVLGGSNALLASWPQSYTQTSGVAPSIAV